MYHVKGIYIYMGCFYIYNTRCEICFHNSWKFYLSFFFFFLIFKNNKYSLLTCLVWQDQDWILHVCMIPFPLMMRRLCFSLNLSWHFDCCLKRMGKWAALRLSQGMINREEERIRENVYVQPNIYVVLKVEKWLVSIICLYFFSILLQI